MRLLASTAILALALGCTGTSSPVIEAAPLPDTHDTAGPYVVHARVFDDREVTKVELVWRLRGAGSFAREAMADAGEDLWRGEIAGAAAGATVEWRVEAVDSDGNRASEPPPLQSGEPRFYSFRVLP